MLNINENIAQVFDSSRLVITSPQQLKEKLDALGQGVANRLPNGFGVNIQRSGERSFCFSIVDEHSLEAVQQFSIQLDNNNQVRWAPIV